MNAPIDPIGPIGPNELICLDCFWTGLAEDLQTYDFFEGLQVCPVCGSDHITYHRIIRGGLAKTKD